MIRLLVHLQAVLVGWSRPRSIERGPVAARGRGCLGQTTAEYALVLLGAAALAILVVTWASKTDAIGKLFDFVIGHVIGSIK
jgi:hypothetical protein